MIDLLFDIIIVAAIVTSLIFGFILARMIVTGRLRNQDRTFKARFTWALVLGFGFVSGWVSWRRIEPWYYISAIEECEHGIDPYPQWAEDRLVHMGTQAVRPIFNQIHGYDVFSKGTCLLPEVLAKIGVPAHRELLHAIDEEKDPYERIGLIYTLQEAFHDNNRLPLWIDYVISQNREDNYLWNSINRAYGDAPNVSDGLGRVNPDFVTWYKQRHPNRLLAPGGFGKRNQSSIQRTNRGL